jgi:hypothetical protein
MLLYRSLVLGLVGSLLMLEVARNGTPPLEAAARAEPPPSCAPTIVDVSRPALAAGGDVAPALGLRPGERIAAIGDAPVADEGAAVAAIRDARPGQYLDLDVMRAGGSRRLLVLVH